MPVRPVAITRSGLRLEGVLHIPAGGPPPYPAAAVCHPHPLYGGDMENNVVWAICKELADRGIATLRFNFRGVGSSEGIHDHGNGEQLDARAALDALAAAPDIDHDRLALAGYSFGAIVALQVAASDDRVAAVAAVAPPAQRTGVSILRKLAKPALLIAGDLDPFAPPSQVRDLAASALRPCSVVVLAGADHSMFGFEADASRAVGAFLSAHLIR